MCENIEELLQEYLEQELTITCQERNNGDPARVIFFTKPEGQGTEILCFLAPGARFSKVPVTLRARNQIFKSKYKE